MTVNYIAGFLAKCAEMNVGADVLSILVKSAGINGNDYDMDDIQHFYNDIVLPTKIRNAGTAGVDYDPSHYSPDFFNNVNVDTVDKFNVKNFAGGATGQFLLDEDGKVNGLTPNRQNIIIGRDEIKNQADTFHRDFGNEMNSTLVHELTHAQNFDADRNGRGRGTSDIERSIADEGYGFNDPNSAASKYYSEVTDKDDLAKRMHAEEIATNRQYRYKLYTILSKKLGRRPSVDEFNSFVKDIPAEEYAKFLAKEVPNGYVDRSRWVSRGDDGKLVYNYDNIEKTRQANMRLARKFSR